MSSDPPMKSTMIGTRCHIVAHVPISTRPPAQFAIDASITSSLNMTFLRAVPPKDKDIVQLCSVKYFASRQRWRPLSVGAPACCHARQPPAIEVTFLYPIFWRLSADSAERKPPPQ